MAAVYNESLGCDVAPAEPSFCQCGEPTIQYPVTQVVTIGDSTMDNMGVPGEAGWGNPFPPFGVVPKDIHNWGSSGDSSLDFETRSNWPLARFGETKWEVADAKGYGFSAVEGGVDASASVIGARSEGVGGEKWAESDP